MPCFDIRQQCSGFLYGLQLADAQIRAGMAETVLLVGAEVHIGFMPWTRANFDYARGVGDVPPTPRGVRVEHALPPPDRAVRRRRGGGGAEGRRRTARAASSTTSCTRDGADYDKLYVPGTGFKHRPYTDPEQFARGDHIPVMDGRFVFKMATTQHDGGRAGAC